MQIVYIAARLPISFTQKFKFSFSQYILIKNKNPQYEYTRKQPTHFSMTPLRAKLEKKLF